MVVYKNYPGLCLALPWAPTLYNFPRLRAESKGLTALRVAEPLALSSLRARSSKRASRRASRDGSRVWLARSEPRARSRRGAN